MLNLKKSFFAIVSFLVAFTNVEAGTLNFECEIKNEITPTGFFETNSRFKIETDNSSVLVIKIPPEGSIVLKENFNNYMNNIYASEYKNLTSRIALFQKDIFSSENKKKWLFKYIVIRINQTIGFDAICSHVI